MESLSSSHQVSTQARGALKYDLTGQKFERWTVLGRAGSMWSCICSCGEKRDVASADLRNGKSKSCGCLRNESLSNAKTKHGLHGTNEYAIWKGMRNRCLNPNAKAFSTYKDRAPDDSWESFGTFISDMGPRPSADHSIERLDNSKPYSKANCVWALPKIQSRNTNRNRIYSRNGETKCLADWADSFGISRGTLLSRIDGGMGFEEAITKPVRKLSRKA